MYGVAARRVNTTPARATIRPAGVAKTVAILGKSDVLIPYGTTRLAPKHLSLTPGAAGGIEADCRVPHVIVDTGDGGTLRLNSGSYAADGADSDALACLRGHVKRHCDLWNRAQGEFVDDYFDLIAARVEAARPALEQKLEKFGTLYGYRDWAFSAPRPLPRAHIPTGAPSDMSAYVPVDFAFRSAGRLVAVYLTGAQTLPRDRRAARDRLRDAGVEVVEIPRAAHDRLAALLPPDLLDFWQDEPFPTGPFKPDLPAPSTS